MAHIHVLSSLWFFCYVISSPSHCISLRTLLLLLLSLYELAWDKYRSNTSVRLGRVESVRKIGLSSVCFLPHARVCLRVCILYLINYANKTSTLTLRGKQNKTTGQYYLNVILVRLHSNEFYFIFQIIPSDA